MLLRTTLVYHHGLPLGWIDVHDDGIVEFEHSGLERMINNLAAGDGAEADATYVWNLQYRLGGPYVVTWIAPKDLWKIGRH